MQRMTLTTPDGGSIYLDRYDDPATPVPGKPWHLVGHGKNFASPQTAQSYVDAHWNDPAPQVDNSYARAEATFGELR